jgi:alkanesulfonate monooxygenase SsuD/methylene tetrahydromethanopterin reductase-like flavin-dependent oxidoreductase (luciferase family)
MQYGFVIPTGDPRTVADLSHAAEAAGWDGVFYWDGICIPGTDGYDPWVVMAAMAMRTERVRLGALLTPLSRRRPWKVARETVTLDHLSGGRLVLPVGLGALDDGGFGKVGEATDRRTRAELLDESLAIITGLWSGRPFAFHGKHYTLEEMTFSPPPVQRPRIPIWVVGLWPREKSMARALRYDGLLPNVAAQDGVPAPPPAPGPRPADIRAMREYVNARRAGGEPFDIVMEGVTPGDDPAQAAATVRPYAEAGATWWIEAMWTAPNDPATLRARIMHGPPRIDAGM